jgi:hypothetical protein
MECDEAELPSLPETLNRVPVVSVHKSTTVSDLIVIARIPYSTLLLEFLDFQVIKFLLRYYYNISRMVVQWYIVLTRSICTNSCLTVSLCY